MGFTRLSSELSAKSSIELDNVFVLEFMPFAPEGYTKVYVFGKMLAEGNVAQDNTPERMAKLLGITEDEVMTAYNYWEKQGLVRISAVPPFEVEYTPAKHIKPSQKTFSKKKYASFNEMLMRMLPEREFLPSELNEYYSTIEDYHLEINAMLSVIAYCVRLKGRSVHWKYIVTVARNLAREGCRNAGDVEEKLSTYDVISDDVRKLFKALKIKRAQDFEDVRLYRKWTEELGFASGTVIAVANGVYGEMKGLDTVLTRYHADGLIDLKEIEEYKANRSALLALTKELLVKLDVSFNHPDYYTETYTKEWLKMGFDKDALIVVADWCFRHNKKSCDKMTEVLSGCVSEGIMNAQNIRNKFSTESKYDKNIKALLTLAGISGDVTTRDRDSYNIWVNYWNVPEDILVTSAKASLGEANPRVKMHALIKNYHEPGSMGEVASTKLSSGEAEKLNDKIRRISADDI